MVQLVQTKNVPAQFVIAKERREIIPDRGDESLVNRGGNIVAEERCFEGGRIISGAGAENVCLHGVGERRRECELMILKLLVKLVKGPLAQAVVPLHEKGAE